MTRKDSLRYIQNTAGGASVADFEDAWAPVGYMEWQLLLKDELAYEDTTTRRIHLTPKGDAKLAELEQAK